MLSLFFRQPVRWAQVLAPGLVVGLLCLGTPALASTPAELLASYSASAGRSANAPQGQRFFLSRHGHDWACASCHTEQPTDMGLHATTGKALRPLAPTVNPTRFTDAAKTKKWLRRNCNDVVGRECSAGEKADVLAWLIQLK